MFFSACTLLPDFEETQIQSSNQDISHLAAKNTKESSEPSRAWKWISIAICQGVGILEVPRCHFLQEIFFSLKVTKITHSLPFWFYLLYEMAILSKVHKPDNFESQNSPINSPIFQVLVLHSSHQNNNRKFQTFKEFPG